MRFALFFLSLLLSLILPFSLLADDFIYDSPYGGKKFGKIDDDGFIYDSPCGGKKIGRVNNGFVYDSPCGGKKVGRIKEDGKPNCPSQTSKNAQVSG
jgi:hypothetical protein